MQSDIDTKTQSEMLISYKFLFSLFMLSYNEIETTQLCTKYWYHIIILPHSSGNWTSGRDLALLIKLLGYTHYT